MNELASLLGRHLGSRVTPDPNMLDVYGRVMRPMITKLAYKVCDWTDLVDYTWEDHLEHYPSEEAAILDAARDDVISGKLSMK